MAENNILTGGKAILGEIRQQLIEVDSLKIRISGLESRQKELEKEIESKKRAKSAEIDNITSKRKNEIEASFTERIGKTRSRMKMVRDKRDKYKDEKIAERVASETAELKEEKRRLKQELKGVLKKNRIPGIFNTEYFFSMFMPSRFVDFLIIFFSIVLVRAIPDIVYILVYNPGPYLSSGMYIAEMCVGLAAFIIYTLIFLLVRNRHVDGFNEAKEIRKKIEINKKACKKTEKSIRKDKNESGYGLEQYDRELEALEAEVSSLIAQQNQAMTDFEANTRPALIEQIESNYNMVLTKMEKDCSSAYDEQRKAEQRLNACSVEISARYEGYIDKNMLTLHGIDELNSIIDSGEANTIAEAIAVYKNRGNDK